MKRGDVARLSKIDFKHYGAAIESLIIKIGWVARFYFAMAKVIYKSPIHFL